MYNFVEATKDASPLRLPRPRRRIAALSSSPIALPSAPPSLARPSCARTPQRRHEEVIWRRLELYHEVTHRIVDWYAERGILVTIDAMRPADEVGREILAALEVRRPLVDHVAEEARQAFDLTSFGAAFGATGR